MDCPFCIKVCTKCKRILVAYNGNFPKNKTSKYGVKNECKKCRAKYNKKYYEEHKDEILEQKKQWYEEHKEEKSIKRKQYYEEHKEQELEKIKEYYEEHKEEISEYQKQWYEEHKEEQKEYKAKYYEEHKEEISEKSKQYYEENKEIILKRNKIYRENNPHIRFNSDNKRRNKLENQGRGITKEQWYEMMCWFDWCCAYSGEYLGGENNKDIRSIDHIVALNNGGLNEPWNCVPMIRKYNISKHTNNMEEWYIQQKYFDEEKLIKIYAWCEYAYEKWMEKVG